MYLKRYWCVNSPLVMAPWKREESNPRLLIFSMVVDARLDELLIITILAPLFASCFTVIQITPSIRNYMSYALPGQVIILPFLDSSGFWGLQWVLQNIPQKYGLSKEQKAKHLTKTLISTMLQYLMPSMANYIENALIDTKPLRYSI